MGTHQARRRRDALHRVGHGDGAPAEIAAAFRPRHRHDRGIQHRGRQRRHPAIARGGTRQNGGGARRQARAARLRGDRRRHTALAGRGVQRQRRASRGAERARRRRRVFVRIPVGMGAWRGLRRVRALRQCVRRTGRVAAWLRTGDADAHRARLLSRQRRAHSAPRPGRHAHATASRHRAAHAAARGLRVRVRPSQSVLRTRAADGRRRGAHFAPQGIARRRGRGSGGRARLAGPHRHSLRRPLRPGRAERGHRARLVDRPAGRAAGVESGRVRARALGGHRARRVAARAHRQVPRAIPPRCRHRESARAGGADPRAVRRRAGERPRAAARDHSAERVAARAGYRLSRARAAL